MSRPRLSVPSQYEALGRASVCEALVARGSCDVTRSANTAVMMMTSMMAPPAAPSGFFQAKRHNVRPTVVGTRGARSSWVAIAAGLIAIPYPRVQDPVEEIDGQVGQDHHDGDEHDQVLHHGVVAPLDRLDQ